MTFHPFKKEENMKSKTWSGIFTLLLAGSLLLSACHPAPSPISSATEPAAKASPANANTTITIGTTEKFTSFDPAAATAARDLENIMNIGEGLLRYKPGSIELEPGLATGMPVISSDGLTYTFTLRDGIKFGDGSALTAGTYAKQLTRLFYVYSGTGCMDNTTNFVMNFLVTPYIKSVTAPDDKTLVFNLKNPAAYFPHILTHPAFVPTNPAAFPLSGCVPLPPAPIYGVGPWYISQYAVDDQVVFEPNPYYRGNLKPQVGKVIVKYFADTPALSQAIQSGAIDIAWQTVDNVFQAGFLDPLKNVAGLHIGTITGGYIYSLVLNHIMAPMDDPNVLKAIASAIDRSALVKEGWGGWAFPAYSVIPAKFLDVENAFDQVYGAPDLEKARHYLEASGYTESHPLQLKLPYLTSGKVIPLIKKQIEATGLIQVELNAEDENTYESELKSGTLAAWVEGWYPDFGDQSEILDVYIFQNGSGTNINKIQIGPEADKASQLIALAHLADIETDQAKRSGLYKQIQNLYADLVVTLPLVLETPFIVYRDGIQGSAQYASPETLNIGPMFEFNYATLVK
jgi:peptide/nickel transport system substrate-binding protein